jgi:hypothetical protein
MPAPLLGDDGLDQRFAFIYPARQQPSDDRADDRAAQNSQSYSR